MRILKLLLAALLVIASTSFSNHEARGQEKTLLPPALNQSSSLAEILDWLDKNAFPHARVGLRKKGGTGPKRSFGLPRESVPAGERIFSEGFHVKSVEDCHVTLSNDRVEIIDASNPSSSDFYRFVTQKDGKRELTPQVALLFLPLDRMSDTRGKGPYLHTNNPEKAKRLGTWRTSFEQKGFFTKVIFEMELTAAEQPPAKELGRFDYLTFTFDSKEIAEQFNAAFRQAIKTCSNK
jgi:hypothetical protein